MAIRALKGSAQVIASPGHPKSYLVFYFRKRGAVEIPGYLDLELIQLMRSEARATVRRLTRREMASVMSIICADNSRLVGDFLRTLETAGVLLPPLGHVVDARAKGKS